MDPLRKDLFEVTSWIFGVFGGLVAAGVALYQMSANRHQRITEHRWRQADTGRKLIDQLCHDELAKTAVKIIDEMDAEWKVDDALTFLKEQTATPPTASGDEKGRLKVLEAFDVLFFHFDRLQHSIDNELVKLEDVRIPCEYYARLLAKHKAVYESYMNFLGYSRAKEFLEKFPEWNTN